MKLSPPPSESGRRRVPPSRLAEQLATEDTADALRKQLDEKTAALIDAETAASRLKNERVAVAALRPARRARNRRQSTAAATAAISGASSKRRERRPPPRWPSSRW